MDLLFSYQSPTHQRIPSPRDSPGWGVGESLPLTRCYVSTRATGELFPPVPLLAPLSHLRTPSRALTPSFSGISHGLFKSNIWTLQLVGGVTHFIRTKRGCTLIHRPTYPRGNTKTPSNLLQHLSTARASLFALQVDRV